MGIFYNNGCHECEERLDERIILILISKAQGACFLGARRIFLGARRIL